MLMAMGKRKNLEPKNRAKERTKHGQEASTKVES